jgi:hypothetical protein
MCPFQPIIAKRASFRASEYPNNEVNGKANQGEWNHDQSSLGTRNLPHDNTGAR